MYRQRLCNWLTLGAVVLGLSTGALIYADYQLHKEGERRVGSFAKKDLMLSRNTFPLQHFETAQGTVSFRYTKNDDGWFERESHADVTRRIEFTLEGNDDSYTGFVKCGYTDGVSQEVSLPSYLEFQAEGKKGKIHVYLRPTFQDDEGTLDPTDGFFKNHQEPGKISVEEGNKIYRMLSGIMGRFDSQRERIISSSSQVARGAQTLEQVLGVLL